MTYKDRNIVRDIFNEYRIYVKPFIPTLPDGRARSIMDAFSCLLLQPAIVDARDGARVRACVQTPTQPQLPFLPLPFLFLAMAIRRRS